MADIQRWWSELTPQTQDWLVENNGDAIPAEIAREIEIAGGGAQLELSDDDASDVLLSDEATDWIEAVANGERP